MYIFVILHTGIHVYTLLQVNHLPDNPEFNDPKEDSFEKHCGKRRKCC